MHLFLFLISVLLMQLKITVFVYELARMAYRLLHRLFRPFPRLALPGPPALRVCLFIARQLSVSSRLHGVLTHGACLLETDQPIFRCQRQIRKRESVTCLPRIVMLYTYTRGWNLDRQVLA